MEQNIKMKELAEQDRPREKLLLKGPQALTDTELLAILLGSGNVEKSALELARVVYQYYGNKLAKLSQLSLQDWEKTKGIGPSKAATLLACFELGRRKSSESIAKETAVKSSVDAFKYFQSVLGDLIHEEFWVLLLNRSHRVVGVKKISEGGFSATVVDPKKVFGIALQFKATAMILGHNHPSGAMEPSEEDKVITARLRKVGKDMELSVLDHLIICGNTYFSFADEGLMLV